MTLGYEVKHQGKPTYTRTWRGLLLGLIVGLSISSSVLATQPVNTTNSEEQNRRVRQDAQERDRRSQEKDVFLQQDTKADEDASLPIETPSFLINELRLEGNFVEKFS